MKINKKILREMVKKEITENWDDVYDDPMEAELARIAYDDDPGGEMIADAAGDEVIDAIHDMIKMDIEHYVKAGFSVEDATKKAKHDAAETLEIAMRMMESRQKQADANVVSGRLENK